MFALINDLSSSLVFDNGWTSLAQLQDHLDPLRRFINAQQDTRFIYKVIAAIAILGILTILQVLATFVRNKDGIPHASTGVISRLRYLANIKFATDANSILSHNFSKFARSAYRLLRSDGDVIILPPSMIQELSSLPPDVADGTKALEHDLMGSYTGLDFILDSRLHHRVVQRKVTPKLNVLAPNLEEELSLAAEDLFPKTANGEWTIVELYPLLLKLTARVSARAFVGKSFCRHQGWLDVATNFVEDLFRTVVILRACPAWTHFFVSKLIPSYWRGQDYFRRAFQILGPYLQDRLTAMDQHESLTEAQQEPTALNWLVEIAQDNERNPDRLARTETVLSLAGIHTMLLRQLSIVYDLTEHQKYVDELRDEIAATAPGWASYASYSHLKKLDSFMRESQRLAPPTVLGLKRIMQRPYTLADGTFLSKGSYVCVAAYAIENDPHITPEPGKFDGLRGYREGLIHPGSNKHAFSSTDVTALGFGLGKTACPGRFFASLVIKMSIVKMLSDFEFRFVDGVRPSTWFAHEFLFASPWGKIQVRRRENSMCPF